MDLKELQDLINNRRNIGITLVTNKESYEMLKKAKMEDKYFTPEITDLRIGYECEVSRKKIFTKNETQQDYFPEFEKGKIEYRDFLLLEGYIKIRVPYLTKEQIIAEGWEFPTQGLMSADMTIYNRNMPCYKNGYELGFDWSDKKIRIKLPSKTLFEGECKDINTFRYICKLLNMK
jgi:hypothetical protein